MTLRSARPSLKFTFYGRTVRQTIIEFQVAQHKDLPDLYEIQAPHTVYDEGPSDRHWISSVTQQRSATPALNFIMFHRRRPSSNLHGLLVLLIDRHCCFQFHCQTFITIRLYLCSQVVRSVSFVTMKRESFFGNR